MGVKISGNLGPSSLSAKVAAGNPFFVTQSRDLMPQTVYKLNDSEHSYVVMSASSILLLVRACHRFANLHGYLGMGGTGTGRLKVTC